MRFDLNNGFPLVTTKKVPFKSVVSELLWFLEGSTDERRLAEIHYGKLREELIGKRTIWTDNADNQGKNLGYINDDLTKELGNIYGAMWRRYPHLGEYHEEVFFDDVEEDEEPYYDSTYLSDTFDQISKVIESIKNNPNSRRHIVSAWNISQQDNVALPSCHTLFQFYVANGKLSCQLYQRSADAFLGVPFNIASYALLTMMIADQCGLGYGEFVHTFGNAHIYNSHMEQVKELLDREPLELPKVEIKKIKDIDSYTMEDFKLINYKSHETIKAKMAI